MKKSIFLSMLISLLVPFAALADSYTSLWKQYDSAIAKDHPQTALRVLSQITDKASRERAYGHLLKAQVATANNMATLSADSLLPAVAHLQRAERAASASGDNVLAAIYQSVLGSVYTVNTGVLDDGESIGRDYYRQSMAHPDALAQAFATGYEPFVEDGVDSKYFYDDMLHIIGMRAKDYRGMHDYYDAHGKREAACLTALEMVRKARRAGDEGRVKKSKYIMSLDSLARQYADLTVAGEVAIERYIYMENAEDVTAEDKMNYINYALMKWGAWPRMNILRNAQRRLTLPSFHASLGGELALPGVPRKVVVMSLNNINELRLTVSRLNIDGTTKLDPSADKDYARLRRHIVPNEAPITDVRHYVGLPAYKTISDTLEIKGLRSGMYLVEVSTDNVSVPVERQLLRVCNIYPVVQALPGKKYRMAVLNATTGVPMQGAKVDVVMNTDPNTGKDGTVKTFTTDANGEVYVSYDANEPVAYRVYGDGETAFPRRQMSGRFYYYDAKGTVEQTSVYTDRRIYRPGQTVHVAALAYTYDNRQYKGSVQAGRNIALTLRDANNKEVGRHTVTTDEYGMAATDFVLPEGALTGVYTVRSDYGKSGMANFSVEEYKRPTFKVDFDKPVAKYAAGDTVSLKGTARSFAGVPVQDAKVAVRVVRRPSLLWRYYGGVDMRQETVLNDTVNTSADGSFTVRVPMLMPETYDEHPRRYYNFDVSADVTDASGETRRGQATLPLSDHPTVLTCDIPAKSLRDSLRTVTFAYRNNAGEPIDGDVTYYIDSHRYTCKANVPARISAEALTSARHKLMAVCGTDTLRTSFVTFALTDRRAAVDTHDWFYQSANQFPASGAPVYVQLGSTDSIQHVVYTIVSADRIIEQGRADLHNELRTRAITYKPEWGDGVTLSVAWVKNGHSYTHTARIERPLPDTRLNLKWATFRDRLTPGQRETWTLSITRPDGTPAKAQLLATLYDKSLDEIRKHNISFALPTYVSLPWIGWNGVYNRDMFAYSEMTVRFLDERQLDYSHFRNFSVYDSTPFFAYYDGGGFRAPVVERHSQVLMENAVAPMMGTADMAARKKTMVRGSMAPMAKAMGGLQTDATDNAGGTDADAPQVQLRENLDETAFFYPGLVADDKGVVSMSFTLPESVTTWQFYGLAHDKDLNNGTISATSVAKKTVMVQPNVPRFVRSADRGVLSARVSNTSDRQVGGTARLTFVDPATGREVYHKDRKFSVKAGQTVVADFDFDMSKIHNDGLLVCRVTASGHGYSDGEQHYLPVMPDNEVVTNTMAFSQNEPGTISIDVDKMFAAKSKQGKLTVEYTNSPAWLMVQALPSMTNPDGDNAMSLAAAYYANALGLHIMKTVPNIKPTIELWQKELPAADGGTSLQSALQKNQELKQMVLAETPWLMDADREAEQKQLLAGYFNESQMDYRIAANLSRMQALQRADGSFAWWKGMEGSPNMTMAVLQTLARLGHITGLHKQAQSMADAAFGYMDKQMAREVKSMKELAKKNKDIGQSPSETAVQYLYASTLAGRKMQGAAKQNFDYLVQQLAKQNAKQNIYEKAVSAIVLAKNRHRQEAATLLESIRQYTVYKDDMGRYFDSPKAMYSWFDYRIPAQVAAIEALKELQPADTKTVGEMRRWLLQSKRTQAWDTPLNSVNAVYAFIDGGAGALDAGDGQQADIKLDGKNMQMPKATAGLGYVKAVEQGTGFKRVTIDKKTAGTSWGAVYTQFVQPPADVADAAIGMTVKREVLKNGKKLTAADATLAVGDRITVRLTVVADRDYDFVQLSDRRAACLEPAQQLSGYGYGYYCQPKDNATNFFFDRMSKGKHVIETTYYVDRRGVYNTGTCAVQCAYSPEFMARTKAVTLNVE